jgi:hypothetical protein
LSFSRRYSCSFSCNVGSLKEDASIGSAPPCAR